MNHLRWLSVLVISIALSRLFTLPVAAQESSWQRPFEVSKPDTSAVGVNTTKYSSAWFPNIAVAPDSSVHVIWYSGTQSPGKPAESVDLLMYRTLRNSRWSQVNSIVSTATGGYTVRNGIAIGRDGRIHVTLRSFTSIKYSSAPWQDAWSAQAWQEPYPISNNNGSYYNSLAIDSHNVLHMVWSEAVLDDPLSSTRQCANCANLYYRSSNDSGHTWSSPINLSNSLDGDNRPTIVIDSRDRIHVTWDQGRDWYAGAGVPKYGVYRRSDDGGKTWTAPYNFAPPKRTKDSLDADGKPKVNPDAPQQTTLAVRPDGNPVAVYRTIGGTIYFQTSINGGNTWNTPRQIPTILARDNQGDYLDKYSMVTDGAGNIHLLLVGYKKGELESTKTMPPPSLLHLVWNGSVWSSPEVVTKSDLYPEYPTAVVAGNVIHVVWYTRSAEDRFTSDRANYRVWYTSRPIPGAPLAQLPLFTPTPTIEATPEIFPTSLPTPTPLPTAIADAPVLDRPPAWESEAIPLILLAVVPSMAILGLIIAVIVIRRRH